MSIAFLNGKFVDLYRSQISPLDLGFLAGDGVSELIPVYDGQLFCANAHLARLEFGLKSQNITLPLTIDVIGKMLNHLVRVNECGHALISISVQAGLFDPKQDSSVIVAESNSASVFAWLLPRTSREAPTPVAAVTLTDTRAQIVGYNVTSCAAERGLVRNARTAGADDAILFRDGYVSEGITSSVFVVNDDYVVTPSPSTSFAGSVTRELLLKLGEETNLPMVEAKVRVDQLPEVNEVWLVSSQHEVTPVVSIDGHQIGIGKPGAGVEKNVASVHCLSGSHLLAC